MQNLQSIRTLGASGLSIGTHLALETIFKDYLIIYDEKREFETEDVSKYKYHVWNLYTIIRNIINSCNIKDYKIVLEDKNFLSILQDEITILSGQYESTDCKPLLFYPDYKEIYKNYNAGKEVHTTVIYQEHLDIRDKLNKLEKKLGSINEGKDYKLPKLEVKTTDKILITTNLPVDLFNHYPLTLLESHTGKIKHKEDFNSKYHVLGKQDISMLPYVEEILYLMGDRNIVATTSLKIRRTLLERAITGNWTVRTTREKVLDDLKKDPEVSALLSNFKRCYK